MLRFWIIGGRLFRQQIWRPLEVAMRNALRLALLAVVICFESYALFAQATPPSGDTFDQKSNPTKTNGASTMLAVQTGSTSYIQFNLATLRANASVCKATLRLFVDAYVASGSFDVYQVNNSWNENTLDYSNAPTLAYPRPAIIPSQ